MGGTICKRCTPHSCKTVHVFLLNNIDKDSDAYDHIQPTILYNDGRQDWNALYARYEYAATVQNSTNHAPQRFRKSLGRALQYVGKAEGPKFDGDVVDWIWIHVQSGELSQHLIAPKVGQSFKVAKEIPNLTKGSDFQPYPSRMYKIDEYTFDGHAPTIGAHTPDGKLFCGTYSPSRWFSHDIRPYHDLITTIRFKDNPRKRAEVGTRGKHKIITTAQRDKREIQGLKMKNELPKKNLKEAGTHTRSENKTTTSAEQRNQGLGSNDANPKRKLLGSKHEQCQLHNDTSGGQNPMKKSKVLYKPVTYGSAANNNMPRVQDPTITKTAYEVASLRTSRL